MAESNGEFTPVNSLEIALRNVIRDKHTPLWSFYTPLGAAQLWVITQAFPELDGGPDVAPGGGNPPPLAWETPEGKKWFGLYTSPERAAAVIKARDLDKAGLTYHGALGYELLQWFSMEEDAHLAVNLGLPECQYVLDPDMVEFLLARPKPAALQEKPARMVMELEGDPGKWLAPLREFLAQQPNVRAAWITGAVDNPEAAPGDTACDLALVMIDPEDKSLHPQVLAMVKALTPVDTVWRVVSFMGNDVSLGKLASRYPPFYAASGFPRA